MYKRVQSNKVIKDGYIWYEYLYRNDETGETKKSMKKYKPYCNDVKRGIKPMVINDGKMTKSEFRSEILKYIKYFDENDLNLIVKIMDESKQRVEMA